MHRFFIEDSHLSGDEIRLDAAQSRQIVRVLRLRAGDQIEVVHERRGRATATLGDIGGACITAVVGESRRAETAPAMGLAFAILKGEKNEWVIQKATELGATRLHPLLTERAIPDVPAERWPARLERWRRVAREAAEQCGRGDLPQVESPRPLAEFLASAPGPLLLADPGGDTIAAAPLIGAVPTLIVGPEGGFSDVEVRRMLDAGAARVRLHANILRAETAAVAGLALLAERLSTQSGDDTSSAGGPGAPAFAGEAV
jgi:16S rRNA (uracil1498-N3)-methyltransferase